MAKKKNIQQEQAAKDMAFMSGKGANIAFWLFGLSGMAALMYEVVWTRALSLVLGSTTYALSTMLASFMAGLSIGAAGGGYLADRSEKPQLLFAKLEVGIAFFGLMAIPLINVLPYIYAKFYYTFHDSFINYSITQFIICFMIMLVPTTLMGATFPVVCKINYFGGENIGKETGGVYAINTVGAIMGALLAGFILIPSVGVKMTNMFAALINISIAIVLIIVFLSGKKTWKEVIKVASVFICALIFANITWLDVAYPFSFYNAKRLPSFEMYREILKIDSQTYTQLFEKENIHGDVKVVQMPNGKTIFVNGRPESDTDRDLLNTALLAYLPFSLKPESRSFLSVGLGAGNTLHYASTIPELKEIYNLEINPAVTEAVEQFFYPALFKDDRIKSVTADARNYLSLVEKRYDIISSEPSYPVDQGFSHLFSKEFFELVKKRLTNDGVFCQWIPNYLFNEEQMAMILKTFALVFPNTTVWGVEDNEILFIGYNGSKQQPTDQMKKIVEQRLKEQGISPDIALYVGVKDLHKVVDSYFGKINTDDLPLLEFYAARNMIAGNYR